MEQELGTMRKHHEYTAEYKAQTMVYLKRYETKIAGLEREEKTLRKENAALRRAASAAARAPEEAPEAASAPEQAQSKSLKSLSAKFTPPATPTQAAAASVETNLSSPTPVGSSDSEAAAVGPTSKPAAAAEHFSTPSAVRAPQTPSGEGAPLPDSPPMGAMATPRGEMAALAATGEQRTREYVSGHASVVSSSMSDDGTASVGYAATDGSGW